MSFQNQNKQHQQHHQQWHQHYAHVASSNRTAQYSMNMFSGSANSRNVGSGGCFDLEMGLRTHTAATTSASVASAYNIFSHNNHLNLPHQQQQHHHISPPHNIKIEPMDNILTPTIEMEELIIKTEPTDESFKISLAADDNNYWNFNKHIPTYHHANPLMMNTTKLQLHHIKEEISPGTMSAQQQQQKPLNFPRRKLQNERSETLPICQRCKQVFLKKHSYTKHVAQSVCDILEYDFKCCICPMSFMSSEELQQHEQLHHRNMYFCHKYCGKYFDTIELCEVHEYMQHEYQSFVCNICSSTFPTRELLFSHMPQHRNQARFDCPVCRSWFHTPHELHQHRIAAPYFCGNFYTNNTAQAMTSCTTFAARSPMPPQHQSQQNYNLQDCRMGVMEVSTINSFSSFGVNNRSYHQQQQQRHQQKLQQQRHQQQLQQQRHQQQSPQLHQQSPQFHQVTLQRYQQLSLPQQQRNCMTNNFQSPLAPHTVASTIATTKITAPAMPIIKTEIKTEDNFFSINENYQQPLLQPDFSSNYTTNDSYSSSHHSFNSNNNDFNDNNSINNQSSVTVLHNALTTPAATSTLDDTDDASCCVPKCGVRKSTSPTLQFFTFPKDEKYLHQWLHNLKMTHNLQINYAQSYRICSLHFPKRCINRYSLCYWAVPTFNLGHDDVANLYQNREITNTFTSGENARCSMPGCTSQRGECNFKFYNFPNDTKSVIKWCQNARLPVYSKEPRHFCSRHFEDRCFGKFRLKPWAVPTLNLGTPYGKIHDNPGIFYLEEKKCCLPHCRRTRSSDFNLSLYRFPRDETLLRRWCYNLRLDADIYRGKNHKICSSHFIKEALGLRKLSPGAVPTLNLGHNDTFNIYENELPPAPAPPPPSTATPSKKLYNCHSFHHNVERRHHPHALSGHLSSTSSLKFTFSSMNSPAPSQQSQKDFESVDVCFVPSCKRNRHTDNVSFHTIPRRTEQMKKWCHNLKLDVNALHKGVRICSAHFETYCIGGCMRPFAVPTLELGHDDPIIYKNPEVIKKLNIRETCCVPHCRRNRDRDHANLHRFPANPTLLDKWCENLRKPLPDGSKLFNDAICEIHFEERCLRNKRLEKWSIPTVNLGHEEIVHELPSEAEVVELWSKPTANIGDEEGECCVEICKRNPQVDDIKLYRMPEDAEVLAKWAYNLQLDAADLLNLRICNLHFESHCIGKRLHSWAIPTLNLGKTVENFFENPNEYMHHNVIKKEKKQKAIKVYDPMKAWMPRCCLMHCRKMRGVDRVHLFRFPNLNRSMLAKWCHNLQMPLFGNGKRRLCSTHFEPHVLTKRCPMPHSVPTVDLNTPPGYKIYQNPARLKLAKLRLERVCIVASCRKNRTDGVQLFRFPHNRTLLKKWCHNTRQKPAEALRAQYRVCSQHFEPHSFGAKRLSPGAIPTLNLSYDDDVEIYANEAQSFAETQCIVNGCGAVKDMEKVRLFKFPCEDEDLLWKWCNNLKMNPVDCQGVRICNNHFEPDCLGLKLLYKWAIPTLELGHDDADIELFSNPKPEERYNEIVSKCCVPTCGKTRKYDDAQMNSFPKHLKMFRRWKHNLKLEYFDFKERDKYKICNDHFEPICVGKMRLNYGAIPTLNLGHDSDDLYKVDPEQIQVSLFGKQRPVHSVSIESQNRTGDDTAVDNDNASDYGDNEESAEMLPLDIENKCSYPNCSASKTLLREVFDIPQQQLLLEIWCALMNVEQQALPAEPKLCGLHFIEVYKDTKEMCFDSEIDTQALQQIYERCRISPAVRSAQCSVPRCASNQFGPNKLYQFPVSTDLIAKWAYNTGIETDDYRRYLHKACAAHFEPYCFTDAQRLRPWAIPTLLLNHAEPDNIYLNPNLAILERRLLGPATNKCCVTGCVREKTDDGVVKLFSFPIVDEVLLEKWLYNLKLERDQCPLYRICEQHFERNCLGNTRLRSWAIPTLNLGHSETEDIHRNAAAQPVLDADTEDFTPPTHVKMKKSLDSIKCAVPSCHRSRLQHGVRLFEFPTRQIMLSKWCHNLKMNRRNIKKHTKICNLHFHKRCIDGKQLRPWAKPTKNLGHTEAIYENPKNLPGIFLPVCCLPHCRQRRTLDNSLRTFALPKDSNLLHKWCANLKITPKNSKARLCIDHFERMAIGKSKLKVGVVPTLNLGHNDPLAYDNSEVASNTLTAQQSSYLSSGDGESARDTNYAESQSNDADTLDYNAHEFNRAENDDDIKEEEIMSRKTRKRSTNSTLIDPLEYAVEEDENKLDEWPAAAPVLETISSGGKKLRAINNIAGICCLRHCRKETTPEHHLTTFGFPKEAKLLQKWCDNLKLKPAQFMGRVCIEHFEPQMLAWGRRLKLGAIPTINLGYNVKDVKHKSINGDVDETEILPGAEQLRDKEKEQAENVEVEKIYENEEDEENDEEDEEENDGKLNMGSNNTSNDSTMNASTTSSTSSSKTTIEKSQHTEKLSHSVFRLCCLKHCRRKKVQLQQTEPTAAALRTFEFPKDELLLRKWCKKLKLPREYCRGKNICEKHFEPQVIGDVKLSTEAVPTLDLGHDVSCKPKKKQRSVCKHSSSNSISNCVVAECKHNSSEHSNLRFFRFPTDDSRLLQKWCDNLQLSADETISKSKVCERHFESRTMGTKRLCNWAVPTLNLGHTQPIQYHNPKKFASTIPLRCCIESCRKTRKKHNVRLFSFPKSNQLVARKWCHNTKQPLRYTMRRICTEHFVKQAMLNGRPRPWAVPTVNLGHNDAIFDNPARNMKDLLNDKCCVTGCAENERNAILFSFPKRGVLLRKWAHNTKQDGYLAQHRSYKVCAKHFDMSTCFKSDGTLKELSIPTLYLPQADIYTNDNDQEAPGKSNFICSINDCGRSVAQDRVKCFAFPKDPAQLVKWCHNLQLQKENCIDSYICNLHFEAACINKNNLHEDAVPTLLLGYTNATIELYQNPENLHVTNQVMSATKTPTTIVIRCCVRGCEKSRPPDDVKMNSFPKSRALYLTWAHNLKIQPSNKVLHSYKVCNEHFEECCKGKIHLRYGAIPTLQLGHNDSNIYNNNMKLMHNGKKRRQKFTPAILKCIVPECSAAKLLNMPLYAMPEEEQLQCRWCEFLGLDFSKILLPNCTKKLCALHFVKAYKFSATQGCFNGEPALAFEKLNFNYERIRKVTRLQAYRCSIEGCDTTWIDNIKLIKFPTTNQELMEKWQHNTKILLDHNRLYLYKVCALHFEERCFGIRIRPWALPTLRLNHADIYQNPQQDELLPRQRCCIQNCASNETAKSRTGELKLWNFPSDQEMLAKWCHNLELNVDSINTTLKICSRHFEPYCIGKLLRVWAMPTLHLNITNDTHVTYQNPDNEVFFYTCCIASCRQTRDIDAGIKLYPFPKNEVIFEKWVHNLRMNAETCRYARICTLHFEKQCIDKMLLKTAVPTLDLGHAESDIFKNPKIKLRTHLGKCCLPHCGKLRHIHNVKLYSFPSEQSVLEKWWHNLHITQQKVKYSKICSKHFEPICINMRGLKPWAIPTRDLGHTNEIIENITPTEIAEYDTKKKHLALKYTTLNTSEMKQKTKNYSPEKSITLKKCCISTCMHLTSADEPTQLFSFPKLDWLLKKWCDNTHISIDAATSSKICTAHFEQQAMSKHKPRPWALPTLQLGYSDSPTHENPKQNPPRFHPEEKESGEMKFVRSCYCAIVSCLKSKAVGVQLFKYPSKGSLLRKWAENCKHYAYQAARYSFRICSDHFEPSCINGNRLHLGSIPTLKLGHTDTEQIHRNDWLQKKQSNNNAAAALQEAQARRPCCVPNCGRTKLDDNVKLFKFPDNAEMLEKWCGNLRMEVGDCKNLNICNMHFEERCIKMGRVLMRAVPTMMLGHTSIKNITKNPETFERVEIECCVYGCHRSKQEDNVTMCALPKVRTLFEKWVHNLKLPSAVAWNNYKYKVCNAHFESYCFERGRLKCGSIPTLNLGHNDEDIYYINEESLSSQWVRGHKGRKHKEITLNTSGNLIEANVITNVATCTNVAVELKCCYPECTEISKAKARHVYALPKVKALRMQWLNSIGLDQIEVEEDLAALKLCPVHYKFIYDTNLEMLQQMLALTSAGDIASSLQDLRDTYVTVSDFSRVRSLSCAVPGCYTSTPSSPQIKLYNFPLNHELSDKWCHNTLIPLDIDRRYAFKVCALHFETYCFLEVSKRLRSWAMPTLQLPQRQDFSAIFENPEPEALLERRSLSNGSSTQHAKCCISSCNNSKLLDAADATTALYNFPKDAELLNKWLCNADISMRDAFSSRICALHFEKHCMNKRLRFWAVPTLNLGHNKPGIYRNPDNKKEASDKKESVSDIENDDKENSIEAKEEQVNSTQDEQENAIGINEGQKIVTVVNESDEYASEINEAEEVSATEISDTEENTRQYNAEQKCAHNHETMAQSRIQNSFSGGPTEISHNSQIYHQFNRFGAASIVAPTAPPPPSVNTSRHCRIPGCTGHADQENTSLYKFPIPDKQFKRWIHNTQISVDTACRWRFRICNRHFESACLSPLTKKLIRGTVPTLNLGPNRPTTIYENACTLMKANKTRISTTNSTRDDDDNQLLQLSEINDDISSQHESNMSSMHSLPFIINECDATVDDSVEVVTTSKNYKKYICGTIHCAIPSCGRKMGDPGIRLHKLPQNSILQRKWIYNCRLDMAAIKDDYHTRVCSVHFTEDCFYSARRKLRFASIPTLLLGHSDTNIYHANNDASDMNDIDMDINCCVRGCNNRKICDGKKNQIIFYSFPKNGKALALWLSLLQMEYDASRPWDYNICEIHFEAQAFYGNSLRENSLPTLNLGLLPGMDDFRSSSITLDSFATSPTVKENTQSDIKSGYRKCCLIHCQKQIDKDNVKIYKFPSSAEQQEKWAHNLRIKFDGKYPWRYLICGNHFEDQCINYRKNRTVLYRWAVPTLNLGNNPPAILFTNENARDTTDAQFEDENLNDDSLQVENEEEDNADEDENDEYDNENIALRYKYQMNMEEEEKSLNNDQSFEVEGESALNRDHRFGTAEESLSRVQRCDIDGDDKSLAYDDVLQYNDDNSLLDIIPEESRTTLTSASGGVGLVSAYATTSSDQGGGSQLKYVRVCSLPHCQRQRSGTVKLFRVPQDSEVVPKWEHNFRVRFDEKHRNTNLICSEHFEPHLIGAHRLLRGSVPTLNLGHSDTNIYTNDANSAVTVTADDTEPFIQYCHVPGCDRSTKLMNASLYKFPRNKHFAKLWMQQAQIEYDVKHHEQICICDAHFLNNCIDSDRGLHKSAIPTLKLPKSIENTAITFTSAREPTVAQIKEPSACNTSKLIASTSRRANAGITCSVPLCRNTSEMPCIKMFSKFPDDFELFTKWCFNLKIDPRKYVDGAYHICSAHFEPFCMGGHSLRLWAVPTLDLGHTSEHIHQVERPAEAETKCCLPHCGRKKSFDGVVFFNFPKGDLYKLWCQILQIDEGHYRNTDKKICSAHFPPYTYIGNILKPGIKPTLNLGPTKAAASIPKTTGTPMKQIMQPQQTKQQITTRNAPEFFSKCIVRTCAEMQHLYKFPENRNLCVKWCHNLKIDYHTNLHKNTNFKICQKHFEPNSLYNRKLHAEAVPTVQLGHTDANIFQNTATFATATRSTPSYDDNSSLRTSVSTINTLNMDADITADMDIEDDAYYTDFDGHNLPQSTFIATDSCAVIELDDDEDEVTHVAQEMQVVWHSVADVDDNDDVVLALD